MGKQYDYSRYYLSVNKSNEEHLDNIIDYNIQLIKNVLPEDKNAKILDVGCGRGYLLITLKKLGYTNIQGVDVDKGQIVGCMSHDVPGEYVEDTVSFLRDHKEEYDLIFLCDVLEHIEKDIAIEFMESIFDALKEGGILFCRVPNANNIIATRYRYIDWTHHTSFTEHSLDFVLYNAGFSNIQIIDEPYQISKTNPIKSTVFYGCKKIYRFFLRIVYNLELGAEGRHIPLNLNIIGIAKKCNKNNID